MLEGADLLRQQATVIDCEMGLTSFRRMHRTWVLACLPVLAHGFEPETLVEFVHVNEQIPRHGEVRPVARAAEGTMRDVLELLRGLRTTLDYDPKR